VPRPGIVSLWLPVVAWAAVIFTLSSFPALDSGFGWDVALRKVAHVAEYAVLALLLMRAVGGAVPAFALAVAYAVSDEVHQHFVRGRHGNAVDVGIDALGVAIGIVAYARLRT
jgi:VanZ family protein